MSFAMRACTALDRVLTEDAPRSVDQDFRVLALVLVTMLAHDDDRAFLSQSFVADRTGVGTRAATRAIGRVLSLGVLEDVTGTEAAESLREAAGGSGRIPSNTRAVRLHGATYRETGRDDPQRESERSDLQRAGPVSGQGDLQREAPGIEQGDLQRAIGQGDLQSCSPSLSCLGWIVNSYAREERLEEYLSAMSPSAGVWNGNALGPKAMRAYGVLVAAGGPVVLGAVRDALALGRKRAREVMDELAAHGLAVQDDAGHWTPGPVRPEDHDPGMCSGCSGSEGNPPDRAPVASTPPVESSTAPSTAPAPAVRREVTLGESVDRCPMCQRQAPTGVCEHCGVDLRDETPAPGPRCAVCGSERPGACLQNLYRPDGTPLCSLPGSGSVWFVQGHAKTPRATPVDPRTGYGAGKPLGPWDDGYPRAAVAAARARA
jgi:hypothetical protein